MVMKLACVMLLVIALASSLCECRSKSKVVDAIFTKRELEKRAAWPLNKAELGQADWQKCLDAHNKKRALHGAPPLEWDQKLTDYARAWALHLAKTGKFMHDPKNVALGTGENLFWGTSTNPKMSTCEAAVNNWYGEIKDYPFNKPPTTLPRGGPQIGHFTQVVWKSTRKVGVGIARIAKKKGGWTWHSTYIVGKYSPPGNYEGQFAKNVSPRQ